MYLINNKREYIEGHPPSSGCPFFMPIPKEIKNNIFHQNKEAQHEEINHKQSQTKMSSHFHQRKNFSFQKALICNFPSLAV